MNTDIVLRLIDERCSFDDAARGVSNLTGVEFVLSEEAKAFQDEIATHPVYRSHIKINHINVLSYHRFQ